VKRPPYSNRGVNSRHDSVRELNNGAIPHCDTPPLNVVITDAGYDWLTVTNAARTDQAETLRQIGDHLLLDADGRGFDVKEMGFHGFKGHMSEGVFFGASDKHVMLRLSGETANLWGFWAIPFARNITRCYLQVTCELDRSVWLAHEGLAAVEALIASGTQRSAGRRINSYGVKELKDGYGKSKGATLYLGSRQSDGYCRLYDKGMEVAVKHGADADGAAPLGIRWRYEVETKRDLARNMANTVHAAPLHEQAQVVGAIVASEFDRRGVAVRYGHVDPLRIKRERKESDDERFFRWLMDQVRPAMEKRTDLDPAMRAKALAALGIGSRNMSEFMRVVNG
jgi:hypothetical protein